MLSDQAEETSAPMTRSTRIAAEATRGLALLGMIAVHALWSVNDEGNVTWTYSLAAGRAEATFALLGGVAVALLTGRRAARRPDARAVVAHLGTRGLVIGLIGLALGDYAHFDVTSVILAYYGVLLVLAIPLTFLATRTLLVTGVALAVLVPALSHLVRGAVGVSPAENPSFGFLVNDPAGLLLDLTLAGMYPALPWLAYVCVGLAIGRIPLSSRRVTSRLLAAGVVTAVVAWAVSWALLGPLGGADRLRAAAPAGGAAVDDLLVWGPAGTTPTTSWWWLATAAPHSATPVSLLHAGGAAVALLGAVLLLAQAGGARAGAVGSVVLRPLAAVGSMPITLYTGHVLFMNSPLDVFDATTGYLVQVVVAVVFAVLWRRGVGRGPLEELIVRLADGARRAITPPPVKVVPH